MYTLNARPASGPSMRPEPTVATQQQQPHSARPSTAQSSMQQQPYAVYSMPNRSHSSAAARSASSSRPATASAPWLPAAASPRIAPPHPAGGLSWSVGSFSAYFPQLTFAQIQQTMSSVLPSFTNTAAARQPSHEDVQQLIQRLQKLAEKHDAHEARRQQIEERQTERRFQLFYNEPLSKSQRIANYHALKAAAAHRREQAERQAELQTQLQIQQAQWQQDPLPAPVTSIPLAPVSDSGSSSAAAPSSSSSPRGPRGGHRASAASAGLSHDLFPRKSSVNHTPAQAARTSSPSSAPNVRGHARMTSGSTLGPPARGHARRASHLPAASMHLAPTVAQSFFSVDFLREVPPRNPVTEWLAAAPALIPATTGEQQADASPSTTAAVGTASPLTPATAKRPAAGVSAIDTTPASRPFSPLSPRSPLSALASRSPRFNRKAKLIALSPERARTPATSPAARSASSNLDGSMDPAACVQSSLTLLSSAQEWELLSFLRSRSDCPFFHRSSSAHHVPSVLRGADLHWLVAHVLQRSVVPRTELVSVMFSVFQNVLASAGAATGRVYHSWSEFGDSCRAVYQLGTEKYLAALADLRSVLVDSPVFATDTGLKLSASDCCVLLESSCESGLVVPAHILSVLSSFVGGARGRRFQSRSELLVAIRAGMRVSPSVRNAILSPLDGPSKDTAEREMHRRVQHLLDLFILHQPMLRSSLVAHREAADAKRRAREQSGGSTDSPSASPQLTHLSPSKPAHLIHSNARTHAVVRVLPLTTPRQCFLAILAALHSDPEAAAATLSKSNNLDEMLSKSAAAAGRNAASSGQLHGAAVQPAAELLHISLASIRTFTARLRAEARIERLWLECSRGTDGVPPSSATAAVSAGAHSTRAQLAIGAQDRVLALLCPRSALWHGQPLCVSHVDQMLTAIHIPSAHGAGGLRMLAHLLSRPGFMSAESASPVDGSSATFPAAPASAESSQQPLAPLTKLKPLLRLLRVRAIQMHAETKKLAAFMESKPVLASFFPLDPPPVESGAAAVVVAPFESPAPLFTHADAVELMLAADCASPSDVLLHLRSLHTFGRSFLSAGSQSPPTVSDGTDALWALAHSIRLLAQAQTRRSEQGYAAGGSATEFQIAAWMDSASGGLFTTPQPAVEVDQIKRWAGLIVLHRGTAASSALPALASHALPELLLFLHHFVATRQHFASVQEMEDNLVALATQRGGVEAKLRNTLYALATKYSRPSSSSAVSPLLAALQTHPSTVSKIYLESCCGPDSLRVVHRLQEMAEDALNAPATDDEAPGTVLCTWQSVEEVLACMRAVVSAQETDRLVASAPSSSPPPSLLPVLESHLVVSEWARPEFVLILSAMHASRSPFLHPSVALPSVADLEALYERLYHSLPLPEVVRLPAVLWDCAANLPWTVPTAAGPVNSSSSVQLDSKKFHSLDQLFHALIAVYALETEGEIKRTTPLLAANEAQDSSASGISPALTSLLSLLEEWLAPNLGSILTPEAVQSLGALINKTHAASILRAAQIAHRKQAAAIHHILPPLPAGSQPLPAPLFDLSEILLRIQSLVAEQGLFLDFASLVDSIAHYQFVPPVVRQIQALLAAAASGPSTARSSGNGRSGGSANGVQLSNGPNGHSAAATDLNNLLDPAAAASVTFDDVFELLDVCDCTGSPLEMLGLLRSLASLAQGGGSSMFDDMDGLISGVRGILALNRAKSVEQALVRSLVAKQIASPRQSAQSPSASVNRARTRSRGGAAADDLLVESMAVAQLARNIEKAAAEIFATDDEDEHANKDEEEEYAFDEDEAAAPANKKQPSRALPPIDSASIQRLLHSAGAASASPLTLLATSRYFLHHLRLDFSRASIAPRAFSCGDVEDLQNRFRELLWRKERVTRTIMRFVLAREAKAIAKGARISIHGGGSPAVHDWTLLDGLFAGEDAPGFACLDLLTTLGSSLPDFATLPSFVDQLRLLHAQSLDEFHAPALTALWRIVMAAPSSAPAVGSASNAASAASKLASSVVNLIDPSSFEATVEDMRAFWAQGGAAGAGAVRPAAAEEVQTIRQRLQQMASEAPKFATIGALVHAYRSRFFTRPHEAALSILRTLTSPACALWKVDSVSTLALNYLAVRSQLSDLIGPSSLQILARLPFQMDGSRSFGSLSDLASAMQHFDLNAPLALNRVASSPSKSASPSPAPPLHHPSALSRSFSTASQDQAREDATARALQAQRIAAEQQQAVALAKRDAELQHRFASERAALQRQLESERLQAVEKENALESQLQALKIQLQQQQQSQAQSTAPAVFITQPVAVAEEEEEVAAVGSAAADESTPPPALAADAVEVAALPAAAEDEPPVAEEEKAEVAAAAITTASSATVPAPHELPEDFPEEPEADGEPHADSASAHL